MIRIQSSLRSLCAVSPRPVYNIRFSSSNKKDDDNKSPKNKELKNKDSIKKLNTLLQQMLQDETKVKLDLAKPKGRHAVKEPGTIETKTEPIEKQVVSAVKGVAEAIGGNKSQTESELLSKLLNGGKHNATSNLSDIVKDMKIDRTPKTEVTSRAQQVRQILDTKTGQRPQASRAAGRQRRNDFVGRPKELDESKQESIDIFGGEALGIFTKKPKLPATEMNKMWNYLHEKELKLAVTHPPANYFQEMILWTEEGKVWQFPINNEQGLETEKNVDFSEHVFLDRHLEPWCPSKGPVRHFMELVCVGLSKNAFLTVAEKREHIDWYRKYFEDKRQLLVDTGSIHADEMQQIEQK